MLVFTGAAALFTGLLVIVGGCGVYAAIRTLLAINRQAYLMERQTVVMESQTKAIEAQLKLAMMQWVSVKEWKVELLEPSGTVPQPKQLLINFDIANESNFPLKMNATFRFGIHQAMTRAYDTGPVLLLPRHPHKATLSLPLTPYDYKCYGEQAILISVTGEIAHVGILKQEGPFMTINGELLCGKTATTSFEFETMTLTPRDEAGEQEPQKAS